MRKRLWSGGALVAVVAIVAAGCGGGSSKNDAYASSKAEFAAALSSICATVDAKSKSLDLSSMDKLAENGPELLDTFQASLAKAKGLQAPDEVKDAADSFVENGEEQADLLDQTITAAKAGDSAKVQELGTKGQELDTASKGYAQEIGATACAT